NKGQLAVLDIIASNWQDRPIYWSLTSPKDQLFGLEKYLRLEGVAQRLVPVQGNNMVNFDVAYRNIMEKFQWGGLDQYDQAVAEGFRGSIMAQKNMFSQVLQEATRLYNSASDPAVKSQYQEKGVDLLQKYFEAYPDFNFPYDPETLVFIQYYNQLERPADMVPLLDKMIDRYAEQMQFYRSLSHSAMNAGFGSEKELWDARLPELANLVVTTKEGNLDEKLHSRLGCYADLSDFDL